MRSTKPECREALGQIRRLAARHTLRPRWPAGQDDAMPAALLPEAPTPIVEGAYLQTHDDLFFTVKGFQHPSDRYVGALRYLPDPAGERLRDGRRYRRVYHFAEQMALLRRRYPDYLFADPVLSQTLQAAPRAAIKRVYDPREFVSTLRQQHGLDELETDALEFLQIIRREAGVAWADLGLSGSALIGLQRPESDLDVVAYGSEACHRVHRALQRLVVRPGSPVRRLDAKGLERLYRARVQDTRLDFDDFCRHERRKVNQGTFRAREYFIRFVPAPAEVAEGYGDRRYRPLGRALVSGTVGDDHAAILTPCVYPLADGIVLSGERVAKVTTLVSYRGRFCEQARRGECVRAVGQLEAVTTPAGQVIGYQLVVGASPGDYILSRAWQASDCAGRDWGRVLPARMGLAAAR